MLSILLAVPSCFNSFWHGVIPTSYFIFNDFYTCIQCRWGTAGIIFLLTLHAVRIVFTDKDFKVNVLDNVWASPCSLQ